MLAEQLSDAGVPVFISDIKGDISGLGAAAQLNDKITQRNAAIGFADYAARGFPVEFLTLDRGGKGVRLRASVLSFGPILLSKVLQLNETQQSVLSLAFKYADDKHLPLIDLPDLRALLNYLDSDDGKKEMEEYGGVATATVGVISARSSSSSSRRRTPSSARRSSTSPTSCAPRRTGRGSSASSSWPTCRTGRRSSPPS